MENSLYSQVTDYIGKCAMCTIATASPDGEPHASTVYFKNIGADLYFNTFRDSQKVRHIQANPRVAIAMQEAASKPESDREIRGIQYTGTAKILSDSETAEVPRSIVARHKAFGGSTDKSVIVRVSPKAIYLIDYSRGFRHREHVDFQM